MIQLFVGYDAREAQGFHVFMESLIRHSTVPFSLTPLFGEQKDGTNTFTYARFMVPYLCDFKGHAIFLDGSDMLMKADIAELDNLFDPKYAIQVVKHDYWTKHPFKYVGTEMQAMNQNYPRKNWSSVVIWNCAHPAHMWMEPHVLKEMSGQWLHRFSWLHEENHDIGALPPEWNVLVGEQAPHEQAKIVHYTLGIPAIDHYREFPHAEEWRQMLDKTNAVPKKAQDEETRKGIEECVI